jgi:hypothetical protein
MERAIFYAYAGGVAGVGGGAQTARRVITSNQRKFFRFKSRKNTLAAPPAQFLSTTAAKSIKNPP